VDVLGCTTSPNTKLDVTRNQVEMIDILPVLYGNGLDSCFPCPPGLFIEIIRVNHLRARLESALTSSEKQWTALPEADRLSAAMGILRRIKTYPVDQWATEIAFHANFPPPGVEGSGLMPGFGGWLSMAHIFQCAIAIYCICSLFSEAGSSGRAVNSDEYSPDDIEPFESWDVLADARKTCLTMLVRELRNVRDFPQLRKFVLWPLVVAGIASADEMTKKFVLEELAWISRTVGIAAPLAAREFLQRRAWLLGLRRKKWADLFDRPYLFAL